MFNAMLLIVQMFIKRDSTKYSMIDYIIHLHRHPSKALIVDERVEY